MSLPTLSTPASALVVCALNLWLARCYSRLPIGQDEGLWLLWGVTGARPYLDHIDCKPPGVHLWGWLLSRVSRRNVAAIKWLHHATIGVIAGSLTLVTGRAEAGLAFTTLAHSVWVYGNHAWVEQLSAGCLALAFIVPPVPSAVLLGLASLFNAKVVLPAVLWLALGQRWIEICALAAFGAIAAAAVTAVSPALARAVWFGIVITPRRLLAWRQSLPRPAAPAPELGAALLIVVPLVLLGLLARPDPRLWIPALAYVLINAAGRIWRPYHLVPLAAFVSVAAPPLAWVVLAADWLAVGFYRNDVIARTRPRVALRMNEARHVGRFLRELPGRLWVTDEFTQIYVYAGRRPAARIVEQVEIRHVIDDRRGIGEVPADLAVFGPGSLAGLPPAYRTELVHGAFTVVSISPATPSTA